MLTFIPQYDYFVRPEPSAWAKDPNMPCAGRNSKEGARYTQIMFERATKTRYIIKSRSGVDYIN